MATKVTLEYVTYDLSNVMTAIGGNLGLFLGYSCINILIWFAEMAKACYSKKVHRKNWSPMSFSQIKVSSLVYVNVCLNIRFSFTRDSYKDFLLRRNSFSYVLFTVWK